MRLLAKSIATGLVAMACAVPAAQAVTFEFTYTGLTEQAPGSFAALGVSATDALTFTVTIDPEAAPRFGVVADISSTAPGFSYGAFSASYDYEALSIGIGAQTFATPILPQQTRFTVRDGIDGTGNTFDDIDVVTSVDFAGPNGTLIDFASMSLNNFDETALTSTEVPTLSEVLAVAAGGQFGANLQFKLNGADFQVMSLFSQGGTLSIREVTDPNLAPIPGPAALPLLATGVGLFGLLTYRRRLRPA